MTAEATLVLVKPDAIRRGLQGLVLDRLNDAKLALIGAKVTRVSDALAREHYRPLREKPFFEEIIQYLCGTLHGVDHVLAFVYAGPGAIRTVRALAGATHPEQADPTSLRGAYGRLTATGLMENVVHASSTVSEAEREIKLWFQPDELLRPLYPTRLDGHAQPRQVWA